MRCSFQIMYIAYQLNFIIQCVCQFSKINSLYNQSQQSLHIIIDSMPQYIEPRRVNIRISIEPYYTVCVPVPQDCLNKRSLQSLHINSMPQYIDPRRVNIRKYKRAHPSRTTTSLQRPLLPCNKVGRSDQVLLY